MKKSIKKVKPANGVFILRVPVKDMESSKVKDYIENITVDCNFNAIEAAGYPVIILPMRHIKDFDLEVIKF